MNEQLLPAAPWYTSAVQVNAVIALAAQLVSVLFRLAGHVPGWEITTQLADAVVADLTQLLTIVFGVIAIITRQRSTVAPLALTRKAAEAKDANSTITQRGTP